MTARRLGDPPNKSRGLIRSTDRLDVRDGVRIHQSVLGLGSNRVYVPCGGHFHHRLLRMARASGSRAG